LILGGFDTIKER